MQITAELEFIPGRHVQSTAKRTTDCFARFAAQHGFHKVQRRNLHQLKPAQKGFRCMIPINFSSRINDFIGDSR